MIALSANALLTPIERIEHPLIFIEDGKISTITTRSSSEIPVGVKHIDFGDGIIAPGLVDLHIHGGVGYDVMQDNEAGRERFERFLVTHGVTAYLPTTVTASIEEILQALERLAKAIESAERQPTHGHAQPLGIHLEGPFLSHARRGVHPPGQLRKPDMQIFERFWQAARGKIRMMTIAPEIPGAIEVIAEASERGVCVSLGHSDATLEQASAGIAAGAKHATHTFNAMRPLGHRDPGIIGEVLSNATLSADIIADGVHVHPAVVKLFLHAKGPERAVLITDATAATGMPDGSYKLGSLEVDVCEGKCLHDGTLAGSVLTLDTAVRNAIKFAEVPLQQVVRFATTNAAMTIGVPDRGCLQAGSRADLVALSGSGHVKATVVNGHLSQ